jgi:predicted transcriptional regulator
MNTDGSSTAAAAATSEVQAPRVDPRTLFSALTHPIRLKLLKLMADGRMISATEAAAIMHRDIDIVIQHLRVLKNAGLLGWKPSEQDARFLLYYLKPEWRPQPNVLDFGFCKIELSAIPDYNVYKKR